MGIEECEAAHRLVNSFQAAAAQAGITSGQVAGVLWLEPAEWEELGAGRDHERLGDGAAWRMQLFVELVDHVAAVEPGGVAEWFARLDVGDDLTPLGFIVSYREALEALRDMAGIRRDAQVSL